MALFILTCDKCKAVRKRVTITTEEANAGIPCKCGGTARRTPNTPSLHTKEVLRFSHQIKDVERFTDAEQLYYERAHKDYSKPD